MIYDTDDYDDVVHVDLVGKRKVYSEAAYSKLLAKHSRLLEALEEIAYRFGRLAYSEDAAKMVDIARKALQEDKGGE